MTFVPPSTRGIKLFVALLLFCVFRAEVTGAPSTAAPQGTIDCRLLKGFGHVSHPVSSDNPRARLFFEQGLAFKYGFNRGEAIRSFECAAGMDPNLAMAYWGIALALGSDVNGPGNVVAAHKAITDATALLPHANDAERAYIEALELRYVEDARHDRNKFETEYSEAMKALVMRFPQDLDAATLYAESLMNLHPFQLWSPDGMPESGTKDIVATLESVLKKNPNHLGANHYYIHAVEGSTAPGRSLSSANRIARLAPASGHLVHMPAHVYFRIGDYAGAIKSNEDAILADDRYLAAGGDPVYGMHYESHNLEFLVVAYCMAGNRAGALRAVGDLERLQDNYGAHGLTARSVRTMILVRFARWQEILSLAKPSDETSLSMWHFSRAMALAAGQDPDGAQSEIVQMESLDSRDALPSMSSVTSVARNLVLALIARARGEKQLALERLRAGVALEDSLPFDEPPRWYIPLREKLGALLLMVGDVDGAERVFREDLVRHPNSGRSLFGLAECLKRLGKRGEARSTTNAFLDAWRTSDTEMQIDAL